MAQWYSPFIGFAVVVAMCVAAYVFAPKGEHQTTWRSSLIISFVACFLMWFITFMAQLNPLIAPKNPGIRAGYEHD